MSTTILVAGRYDNDNGHYIVQVNSGKYPWIAQLVVRDIWYHEDAIFASSCSAVLVSLSIRFRLKQRHTLILIVGLQQKNPSNGLFLQIGGRWAVTAAHCVYDKETNTALEPGMLSIILGLPDKRGPSQIAK